MATALQLHDHEEEIIGTILLREKDNVDEITTAWDKYLSEEEKFPCIWTFVNSVPKLDLEVLTIDFYQP